MNRRTIVSLCCVVLLGTAIAGAQTTEIDWAHGTDFSRFHTFSWATGAYPIQDPDASLGFARAVRDELQQRNVSYVEPNGKFDLFVTYTARISPDPQTSSRNLITVKVLIFDSRNNNVIWRSGGYVALVQDKQQNRDNVRALLDEMFQKYPPQGN
jgi:Domain of unknown function (DUF4136)